VLKNDEKDLEKPLEIAQTKEADLRKSVATLDKDQIALKNARGFLKDIK